MHNLKKCSKFGCSNIQTSASKPLCTSCSNEAYELKRVVGIMKTLPDPVKVVPPTVAQKYPKYYKAIPEEMTAIDVYGVHILFDIQDPSGAIQHASKKLLLSGVRTGGKTMVQDIKEARDTLNRWLELNSVP